MRNYKFELKRAVVKGNVYLQIWVDDVCFHIGSLKKVLSLCVPDWENELVLKKGAKIGGVTKLTVSDVLATNSGAQVWDDVTNSDD